MDTFECILAIEKFRNMTEAAEQVYMTQPALSLRISRFEKELGFRIFNRTTPITLTREGELYIREMRKIKDSEEILKNKIYELAHAKQTKFVLGIGFNRGCSWLPSLLPLLMKENEDIDLQIAEASDQQLETGIQKSEIDIAIVGSSTNEEDFYISHLGKEKIIALSPSSYINAKNDFTIATPYKMDINDLNDKTLILPNRSFGIARMIYPILENHKVTPKNILHIDNNETSYNLAKEGIGIVFLPCRKNYVENPLSLDNLIPCILKNTSLERATYLICKKTHAETEIIIRIKKQIESWYTEYEVGTLL